VQSRGGKPYNLRRDCKSRLGHEEQVSSRRSGLRILSHPHPGTGQARQQHGGYSRLILLDVKEATALADEGTSLHL
jgi:hypothetical protein